MSPTSLQPNAKQGVRKSFLAFLCAVLAIACGVLSAALIEARAAPKPRLQSKSSDLDSNGLIMTGWSCTVDDADPGQSPAGIYAYANMRLAELVDKEDLLSEKGRSKEIVTDPNDILQIRGINPEVHIFITPEISGCRLGILSGRRLTKEEEDRVRAYAGKTIEEAVKDWNGKSFHQKGWIPHF